MKAQRYLLEWHNKCLTDDARSIDEMISTIREAADELKQMRDAGVYLDPDGGTGDDCALLVTTDRSVAARFKFPLRRRR